MATYRMVFFLTGKYDQARNYYKKILDNQPHAQDLLNAGHTEWALQISRALSPFTSRRCKWKTATSLSSKNSSAKM